VSLELFREELVGDGRCLSLTHFDNGTDSAGVELMSQGESPSSRAIPWSAPSR